MEFKGTKGKWNLLSNVSWCEIQTESPIKSICAINKNIEEYEANALLISKAPEMLEMLKELYGAISIYNENNDLPKYITNEMAKSYQLIKEATEI
jgi:hypothetical protein